MEERRQTTTMCNTVLFTVVQTELAKLLPASKFTTGWYSINDYINMKLANRISKSRDTKISPLFIADVVHVCV